MRDNLKVVFLCTANSCRSIVAEAVFNHLAPAKMRAVSAGSRPCGWVHPQSLEALERAGIARTGLHSKSISEHASMQPDLIITLCDSAAAEDCPSAFASVPRAHWGLSDPAAVKGSAAEVSEAFDTTVRLVRERVEEFLRLPLASLDDDGLQQALQHIGQRSV
jgi:arsenate reductase (thioredoxin)